MLTHSFLYQGVPMNEQFTTVLQQAIGSNRPTTATLVEALLQTEKAAKQQTLTVEKLLGNWQLHFSSRGKVKLTDSQRRGFYLPSWLPAQIGFAAQEMQGAPLTITNQVAIGAVKLKLSGPARFSEKKNLLAFDFTRMEIQILGQTVYNGKFPSPREGKEFMEIPIGKLPFFAFFVADGAMVAARGRGGGLAIWVRG
jgi:hypothetical protein